MSTMRKFISLLLVCLAICLTQVAAVQAREHGERYQLKQVLALSRHGVRAPLYGKDSFAARSTPHKWLDWSAQPGELTVKGGAAETLMGQYFRLWLEDEGLIPHNYLPAAGEVRIYANSFQRTIATARFFTAGMMPLGNIEVERHLAINEADPVFMPGAPNFTPALEKQTLKEVESVGGIKQFGAKLQEDCNITSEVLDFGRSPEGKGQGSINASDISLNLDKGLKIEGALRNLHRSADALVLQYYEETNDKKAAFGHEIGLQEWLAIGRVAYCTLDFLYTTPTYDAIYAHGMLSTIQQELANDQRKFTFLCGHDINLATVLPALGVEDYVLEGSLAPRTPLSGKLVICVWQGEDGEYADLRLVYPGLEQLRHLEPLSLARPPQVKRLKLKGLRANEDGLYRLEDLQERFASALAVKAKYL